MLQVANFVDRRVTAFRFSGRISCQGGLEGLGGVAVVNDVSVHNRISAEIEGR